MLRCLPNFLIAILEPITGRSTGSEQSQWKQKRVQSALGLKS